MPDEMPGPPCYCGKRGCIETYLSGPGLERDHRERTGEPLTTREIVAAAEAGEEGARESLRLYRDRLGRGLASVINVLDPDVVVLGGGMSNLPGLAEAARAAIVPYVFTDDPTTHVVLNRHGDSSGVRGAAWLWPAE
jgi:fructokinase